MGGIPGFSASSGISQARFWWITFGILPSRQYSLTLTVEISHCAAISVTVKYFKKVQSFLSQKQGFRRVETFDPISDHIYSENLWNGLKTIELDVWNFLGFCGFTPLFKDKNIFRKRRYSRGQWFDPAYLHQESYEILGFLNFFFLYDALNVPCFSPAVSQGGKL